jgi:hypothetical protein
MRFDRHLLVGRQIPFSRAAIFLLASYLRIKAVLGVFQHSLSSMLINYVIVMVEKPYNEIFLLASYLRSKAVLGVFQHSLSSMLIN